MHDLSILLAVSDPALRERLAELLRVDGYGVRAVPVGLDVPAAQTEIPHDLVLLSDDLPDTDVLDLTKSVRHRDPGLPVIVLAGEPNIQHAVEAMKRGANNYLALAGPGDDLRTAVASALEAKLEIRHEVERRKAHRLVSFEDLESLDLIDEILGRHGYDASRLVGILQDIQKELRYLTQDSLRHVAGRLGVPLPRVYSVATFYKAFSLKPRGRHTVSVCLGTACHVKGGVGILEKLERELGIKTGEMTFDERFSLESVRCVGCCGLAPVVVADEDFHGRVTQDRVPAILKGYE